MFRGLMSVFRASALAGLTGALLMFGGDMLFYGQWGTGRDALASSFRLVASMPADRLTLGGLLALPSGAAYLLTFFHLRRRLIPTGGRAGLAVLTGLAAILVIAVATHVAWGGFALAAQSGSSEAAASIGRYLNLHFLIGQIIAVPTALALAFLVGMGRTSWPRWTVVLNPGLLYVVMATGTWIPAPVGAAVVGGAFNLAFAAFFLMSAFAPDRPSTRLNGP